MQVQHAAGVGLLEPACSRGWITAKPKVDSTPASEADDEGPGVEVGPGAGGADGHAAGQRRVGDVGRGDLPPQQHRGEVGRQRRAAQGEDDVDGRVRHLARRDQGAAEARPEHPQHHAAEQRVAVAGGVGLDRRVELAAAWSAGRSRPGRRRRRRRG